MTRRAFLSMTADTKSVAVHLPARASSGNLIVYRANTLTSHIGLLPSAGGRRPRRAAVDCESAALHLVISLQGLVAFDVDLVFDPVILS